MEIQQNATLSTQSSVTDNDGKAEQEMNQKSYWSPYGLKCGPNWTLEV
jgi:hypothetical protein